MQEESSLRIVFAGTPPFAAECLAALLGSEHRVVGVYTQPDRPAGRGKKLGLSAVKELALAQQLPVFQPGSLRPAEAQDALESLDADLMVVVAYGLILPQAVLDIPRYGCLNVHASLLPRWRGAAPVQRAIEAGDRETGITIMQMDAGLDTGPMLATARCEIKDSDTTGSLLDRLAEMGGKTLLSVLRDLPRGALSPALQDESQATYASKIEKSEAAINWQEPAEVLHRKIRAFNPSPMAFSHMGDQRIKILRASPMESSQDKVAAGTITTADSAGVTVQCGSGSLRLEELQLPGKRPMPVGDLLRGNKSLFSPGQGFHSTP